MPPGDDTWIDTVADELTSLGVIDEATRSALLDALRDAADSASVHVDLAGAEDRTPARGGPRVTVLDGGRPHRAPAADAAPPDWTVVPGGRSPDEDDVRVHIVRVPADSAADDPFIARSLGQPPGPDEGWIEVEPGEVQVLQRRLAPAALRVFCDEGALHLSIDGDEVSLREGQSVDVDGRYVTAACPPGSKASGGAGRYQSLPR